MLLNLIFLAQSFAHRHEYHKWFIRQKVVSNDVIGEITTRERKQIHRASNRISSRMPKIFDFMHRKSNKWNVAQMFKSIFSSLFSLFARKKKKKQMNFNDVNFISLICYCLQCQLVVCVCTLKTCTVNNREITLCIAESSNRLFCSILCHFFFTIYLLNCFLFIRCLDFVSTK